jgi:hypothetical protein
MSGTGDSVRPGGKPDVRLWLYTISQPGHPTLRKPVDQATLASCTTAPRSLGDAPPCRNNAEGRSDGFSAPA